MERLQRGPMCATAAWRRASASWCFQTPDLPLILSRGRTDATAVTSPRVRNAPAGLRTPPWCSHHRGRTPTCPGGPPVGV
jgi:hypothetical protein